MNAIFCGILIISIILMLFINPAKAIDAMISGGVKGVSLCINLLAIYAVWLGLLNIAEKSGVNKLLEKILKPIIKFLFGKLDEETAGLIAVNLSANILGMGNASTPSGIRVMQNLDKKDGKVTPQMSMFVLLNALSLQILPTTIIGLRVSAGSSNPTSIFFPIIIVSYTTLIFGVLLMKIFTRRGAKNE